MSSYLYSGRIWAEEGTFFYENINNLSFYNSILYIYNGHLELVTNLLSYLSTRSNFKYSPLITTYGSFFVQSIPIVLIIIFRKSISISKVSTIFLIILFCGIPQSVEVWANTVNLHFYFSITAALILLINCKTNLSNNVIRFLLLICGLSGIPPNFLTPVYLYKAIVEQQRENWVQFFIIFSTTLLQLFLLYSHLGYIEESGKRIFEFNPFIYWSIVLSQEFISPLLGIDYSMYLYNFISSNIRSTFSFLLVALIPTLILVLIAKDVFFSKKSRALSYLLYSIILLTFFSILTSHGEKFYYISPEVGFRYFYAPTFLIFLSISIKSEFGTKLYTKTYLFIATVSALLNSPNYIDGPSWAYEYNKSLTENLDRVNIWPKGWDMKFY
jgi:hypothetical protein